jgi:DNA-directed RNA polymerase subunit F
MVKANTVANPAEGSSMEQVRELLFGAQFKEMEVHLQRQDERVQRELADMREMLKARLESLENFMKSEHFSIIARINTEKEERDNASKDYKREFEGALQIGQRELAESIQVEQRERVEHIKTEQRERFEAMSQMNKELLSLSESFDRKLSVLSSTFDSVEREIRQLLQKEGNNLSGQVEDRYQQVLEIIRQTAEQIRQDTVSRNAISGLFMEAAVKFNSQLSSDLFGEAPAKKREK